MSNTSITPPGWVAISEGKARASGAGFDEHLVKPMDLRTLQDALARVPRQSLRDRQAGAEAVPFGINPEDCVRTSF
jgi:hypothetical protein